MQILFMQVKTNGKSSSKVKAGPGVINGKEILPLKKYNLTDEFLQAGQFGPTIGKRFGTGHCCLLPICSVGMLAYITFRFEFKFGVQPLSHCFTIYLWCWRYTQILRFGKQLFWHCNLLIVGCSN